MHILLPRIAHELFIVHSGNFQAFRETTQLLLLTSSQIISIIGIVIVIYYIVFLIYWGCTRKKVPLKRLLYSLVMLIMNSILATGSLFIQEFSRGLA